MMLTLLKRSINNLINDYAANERNLCLIIDDRASGKNWWYWFKQFFKLHPDIAEFYTLRKAEGEDKKQYDVTAIDLDVSKIILFAELKKDDLTLNMKQLEYELGFVYTPILKKTGVSQMHLICAPSKGNYNYGVIKRLIGVMNNYPWIRYHVHGTPLLAINKLDQLIRNPPEITTPTLPEYAKIERKGFAYSISSLMDSIPIELGTYLEPYMHPDITEYELGQRLELYYGKRADKKASDLYNICKKTWWPDIES